MMYDDNMDKGNYCLIIEVTKDCNIKIGAKGMLEFSTGYYVYVGSALNSLSSRIKRHLSSKKKKHWHCDYLLLNKNTKIIEVIYTQCSKKIECEISYHISKDAKDYIEYFGCSDCNCESHLYYFKTYEKALESSKSSYENINYKAQSWLN